MEIENTQTQQEKPQESGEKTFTQEDVNRIVGERLAKDRAKSDADLVKREQELTQRELHLTAKEMLSEKGLPKELADILKFSDRETLEKNVSAIGSIIEGCKGDSVKLRGFQPGQSSAVTRADLSGDLEIRKAMGLPVK